eukprot:gb/GEZN01004216.1/.p1 GENE.gb/GEZN01004216.1/~~gb/GEZN01004216.1/.p1  ORF type:complete len:648 (-),score=30.14 gb/GEZN01004216.1/:29-1972(-)
MDDSGHSAALPGDSGSPTMDDPRPSFPASRASTGASNNSTILSVLRNNSSGAATGRPTSTVAGADRKREKRSPARQTGTDIAVVPELAISKSVRRRGEAVVANLALLFDPPVPGCELVPYVSILEDGKLRALSDPTVSTNKASNDEADYRWFKGTKRICSVEKCQDVARMQCLPCLRARLPAHVGFFCSHKCMKSQWALHRHLHRRNMSSTSFWREQDDEDEYEVAVPDSPSAISCKFPPPIGNVWRPAGRDRVYYPTEDDVGCSLKLECAPILLSKRDSTSRLGEYTSLITSPVICSPGPPPNRRVMYSLPSVPTAERNFKTLNYNVLAQLYATKQIYPYAETWVLQWSYRKNLLLREILSHNADVVCLQEVQANHFETFFHPEMSQAGYDGIFKRKTREPLGDDPGAIDGCAIFYKRERFALREQYGIEFNEAAKQHNNNRKSYRRLLRGNVALVVVLEEIPEAHKGDGRPQRRQRNRRLCVANTHIYWDPEFREVKLWQTWVLCRELEKLVLHRNLPLVLCGDFNSMQDSSVYELLSTEQVHAKHPVFQHDPYEILPPSSSITHRLPLVSAYARIGEPKFTNYTGHFIGVLDYIWYSKAHLVCTSCLDVDGEKLLKKNTALPNPQYASDHLSLVCEFDWLAEAG